MYLGIDLGTSGLKVVVLSTQGDVVDSAHRPLSVINELPLHSEQAPDAWWQALTDAMQELAERGALHDVRGIGLSGQMHGTVLLDAQGELLMNAILWNDGRSFEQCDKLSAYPNYLDLARNHPMPGFSAPKLQWVKEHLPEIFARIDKVLLPKDYLRYKLSGDFATDMADASGTLWLDVEKRQWHSELLALAGLCEEQLPSVYEGDAITGYLSHALAEQWQMPVVPIVAGAGDNACGAMAMAVTEPGQAILSLGTSGVFLVATDKPYANTQGAVHNFCHALEERWISMSVSLSAASCLAWYAKQVQRQSIESLLAELDSKADYRAHAPVFLPYLSGERTPHNNPHAQGAFIGLTHQSEQPHFIYSVLEGVAFAMYEGACEVFKSGAQVERIFLIGGGAKSDYWCQLMSDVFNMELVKLSQGELGPSVGAAKLAQRALGELVEQPQEVAKHYQPNPHTHDALMRRYELFKSAYRALK